MTAKEYLGQAYWLDTRINSKLNMVASLREMATRTTSVMGDEAVSHARNVHSTQDVIAKIVDLENEINADIDRLVDMKQEIMNVIASIDRVDYCLVLELRYLCFNSWEEIAQKMNCTVSNAYKLHFKALQHVSIPKLGS